MRHAIGLGMGESMAREMDFDLDRMMDNFELAPPFGDDFRRLRRTTEQRRMLQAFFHDKEEFPRLQRLRTFQLEMTYGFHPGYKRWMKATKERVDELEMGRRLTLDDPLLSWRGGITWREMWGDSVAEESPSEPT